MFTSLQNEFPHLIHLKCLVHMLHNACKEMDKTCKKGIAFIKLFSETCERSSMFNDAWRDTIEETVIQGSEHRFGTVVRAGAQLLKHWDKVQQFLADLSPTIATKKTASLRSSFLVTEYHDTMQQIVTAVEVGTPLADVIQFMEGRGYTIAWADLKVTNLLEDLQPAKIRRKCEVWREPSGESLFNNPTLTDVKTYLTNRLRTERSKEYWATEVLVMKSAYLFCPFALAARRKSTVRSCGIWNFCQAIPSIEHLYHDLLHGFQSWEAILALYRTGGEEEEKKGEEEEEEEEEDEVVNYEHFLKFLLTQPVPQCWMEALMTFLTIQLTSIQAERLFSILGGSVAPEQKVMKLDRVRLIMISKSNHENEEKDMKNQLMDQKDT